MRWDLRIGWAIQLWMVLKSVLIIGVHSSSGGILGSQAQTPFYHSIHPWTDSIWIFLGRELVHPGSEIQSLDKRSFGCLGDMQNLLMYSGMANI